MKLSTKARYGLRMMVELARALKQRPLIRLGDIAKITGVSQNYLAQLAMPLRHAGLLVGISGKKGGYALGRPADEIKLSEILQAVQGPISLTDCSLNPELCLYAPFCESRMIWVLAAHKMQEVFESYHLSDLVASDFRSETRHKFPDIPLLEPDQHMSGEPGPMSCSGPPPRV
ncbi:MAG: Rrf2 family transcriptional regulator [bacterium]